MRLHFAFPGCWFLVSVAVVCVMPGCWGGDGLTRYPISGTVSYQGKPVAAGMIFFEPRAAAGDLAPTVVVSVKDGVYDTGSEGPVAGKYQVVVGGIDRANERMDGDGRVYTPSLFNDYKFDVEIPPADNTLNIEVPDSQAIRRR